MTYGLAIQVPETPIVEEWSWITDIGTSFNGNEDRLPLLRYPRRTFSGNYLFTDKDSLRRHLAMMTKRFKTEFRFPLFQYQTKLKAPVAAGDMVATVNARRGNFRAGQMVVVMEGSKYEEIELEAFDATTLTFATELQNSYSARAFVCPVAKVFTNTNASVTRLNPDHAGRSSFNYVERLPTLPFVSPLNEAEVEMFDGLPVLNKTPLGSTFDGALATGATTVDYTSSPDFVSPWQFAQWSYSLTFKADLMGDNNDLDWWQKFGDEIQGSANPFLFPTNRNDLRVLKPAEATQNTVTLVGDEFSQHYNGQEAYSRIFIDTTIGRHYAAITGVASVAGNDRIVFSPALPFNAFPIMTTVKRGGQLWKYKVVALDDNTDYSAPLFNDAAWPVARAPFGDTADVTAMQFGKANTVVGNLKRVWMRSTFMCKYDPTTYTRIVLYVDDHYSLWFNGVLLGADGSDDPMGDLTVFLKSYTLPDGLLVAGENHIALRADDKIGGDFFADLRIEALLDEQRIGFLLKVRNNDDKITCEHKGLSTNVKLSIRTVE